MLDLFFRKYAWTANLLLLLGAAWLSARTVNTLVGAAIRPRPQVDLSAAQAAQPRQALPTTLDPDRLYHLIGVEPPKPVDAGPANAPPTRPQTCSDTHARPVKTDLRLQLVAAVQAERPSWSLATIADSSTRETRILGVGDDIQGAKLIGVERVRDERDATGNGFRAVAIICNGGTKEYVDTEPGTGAAPEPNLGFAPVARPGAPVAGVRSLGENRYEVDRSTLDRALNNMSDLATQARIVPSFKNGVADGFKLFSIQPGSLYASIGIENGDVIQSINGYEMNSPDKALEIYQKLKESSQVTLKVNRGGTTITKTYNINGP